jgi:SAM-dependent methyltransferase
MPLPFPKGSPVLDVGCGNGQRLAELERCGLSALFGVEPTVGAAEVARRSTRAQIFMGVLEEAHYADGAFGLVIMNQVLEHVPSPTATLREIHRILVPGGRLYLTVPNFGSFEASLCGPQWAGLRLPEHLHHFTSAPLRTMLERAGFRIEVWRTDTVLPIMRESLVSRFARSDSSFYRRSVYRASLALAPFLAMGADWLGRGQMLRAVAVRI